MAFFEREGVRIFYLDEGKGDVIVFLHGVLFHSGMFKAQIRGLSQSYRCIAPDFRGQGRSSVPDSGYELENLATDIIALTDHLGIRQFHLVGLSMGGFTGLRIALKYPAKLKSLILINSSADTDTLAQRIQFPGTEFYSQMVWINAPYVEDQDHDVREILP